MSGTFKEKSSLRTDNQEPRTKKLNEVADMKSEQMKTPDNFPQDIEQPKKAQRKKPLAAPKGFQATAKKDGEFYFIEFENGLMTQGKGLKNALVMAIDVRAINDDRTLAATSHAGWTTTRFV